MLDFGRPAEVFLLMPMDGIFGWGWRRAGSWRASRPVVAGRRFVGAGPDLPAVRAGLAFDRADDP